MKNLTNDQCTLLRGGFVDGMTYCNTLMMICNNNVVDFASADAGFHAANCGAYGFGEIAVGSTNGPQRMVMYFTPI